MSRLEGIYRRLPEWLQDVAVSLQGISYYRQRYGGEFAEEFNLLKAIENSSALQLELLQVARLRRMLAHAASTVPFYRNRIPDLCWENMRAGDWSALGSLPVTEKQDLRRKGEQFISGGRKTKSLIPWNTSGSTGTPLQLFYSPQAVSRQYAHVENYRQQAGVSRFMKRAQFTGKTIVASDHPRRFWRYDWGNSALMLSSVHLTGETIPKYLEALSSFAPAYLTGYPSAIYLLARYALKNARSTVKIPVILTSAETLLSEQRRTIEAAFGAKVFDQYGQTEMQSFWFECRYQRMHANPLFGVTEIVRPDGSACANGETGDVLLTGLINDAMPLIRYRIGDRAAWSSEERCPCGRAMPIIERIEGRREDYLFSPQRGWVGRMDPALKGVEGIVECQFIQHSTDGIQVLCVPDTTFKPADQILLENNLKSRLGNQIQIEVQLVSSIPRGPNGKFRAVVSKLPGQCQLEEVA